MLHKDADEAGGRTGDEKRGRAWIADKALSLHGCRPGRQATLSNGGCSARIRTLICLRRRRGDRDAFAELLERHLRPHPWLAWRLNRIARPMPTTSPRMSAAPGREARELPRQASSHLVVRDRLQCLPRSAPPPADPSAALPNRLRRATGLARAPDGRDLYDAIWLQGRDRAAEAALS